MHDQATSTNSPPTNHALIALCFALAIAICGLAYTTTVKQPSGHVITGNLDVTYVLITLKNASSEQSGGSTISASRVEYFPTYVLVTTSSDITLLWPIDRLKKLEVARVDKAKSEQSK